MTTIELTDSDRYDISNALRIAAEVYETDANTIRTLSLVGQFRNQAQKVRELANKIEQAE